MRPAKGASIAYERAGGTALPMMRVPSSALRLVLGRELADNTVLTSQRVVPAALTASGFTFRDATIDRIVASALASTPA